MSSFLFFLFLFQPRFFSKTLLEPQYLIGKEKWARRREWAGVKRKIHQLIIIAKLWLTYRSTEKRRQMFFNPLIINHVGTSFFFLCLLELKIRLCDWFYYNLSMFIRKWKVFYLLLASNLLLSCFFSRFMNCLQKAPHFCNVAFLNSTGDF